MSEQCRQCQAKCCKYFCFQIDAPDSYREYDDIRWYLCHTGVTVHIDEDGWFISIPLPCDKLTDDHRCDIYDDRPMICRSYQPDTCDHSGGDYEYKALFRTGEELEAYARKALGEATYNRARAAARARAAKKGNRSEKGNRS